MISGLGPRPGLVGLVKWLPELLRSAFFGRSRRFLLLSPPVLKSQIVFDKENLRFEKISIESSADLSTLRQVFGSEDYSLAPLARGPELVRFYEEVRFMGKTPLVVDCGANIGLAARWFNTEFPEAKIVAIEPDSQNFTKAERIAGRRNVELLLSAVGSKSGFCEIVDPGLGNDAYRTRQTDLGTIPIVSIPDILEKYRSSDYVPFIIKIDIEGAESDLFSANLDWMGKFPLLIIELHDWLLPTQKTSQAFLEAIAPLGRDFVHIGENIFSIGETSFHSSSG